MNRREFLKLPLVAAVAAVLPHYEMDYTVFSIGFVSASWLACFEYRFRDMTPSTDRLLSGELGVFNGVRFYS